MSEPTPEGIYEGSCHCCAVTYSIKMSPPFPAHPVNSCDCSICTTHGYLFVYVNRHDLIYKSGEDQLKTYQFGPKMAFHKFCGTCGSSVISDPGAYFEKGYIVEDILAINVGILLERASHVQVN